MKIFQSLIKYKFWYDVYSKDLKITEKNEDGPKGYIEIYPPNKGEDIYDFWLNLKNIYFKKEKDNVDWKYAYVFKGLLLSLKEAKGKFILIEKYHYIDNDCYVDFDKKEVVDYTTFQKIENLFLIPLGDIDNYHILNENKEFKRQESLFIKSLKTALGTDEKIKSTFSNLQFKQIIQYYNKILEKNYNNLLEIKTIYEYFSNNEKWIKLSPLRSFYSKITLNKISKEFNNIEELLNLEDENLEKIDNLQYLLINDPNWKKIKALINKITEND